MEFMRVIARIADALDVIPQGDAAAALRAAQAQAVRDYADLGERQAEERDPEIAARLEQAMIEHGQAMDALAASIARFDEARKRERGERAIAVER